MSEEIIIDAKSRPIGRVASEAAMILNGKTDSNYMPNKVTSKRVKVINVGRVIFSGGKLEQKKYYRHSGYPGAIKSRNMKEIFEQDPAKLFLRIVSGMIAGNRLRSEKLKKLAIEV